MHTHDIVTRYLAYFERKGHTVVPGSSLLFDDPTLLFVNAGMVPFKPYLACEEPAPYRRAVSVQKCLRTVDIDNVGVTARHNTFFEMPGNFSFGDYFKEEVIGYAWEFATSPQSQGCLGLDPDRLWVTVFQDDDEAVELWQKIAGLPKERIQRLGIEDNFWSMGVPGPCGPSSELFYDRGPQYGRTGGPAVNEDRYMEFWNLVFMTSVRGPDGAKKDYPITGTLPMRNIDTGLGLERVASLVQGVDNVYETDLLRPVITKAEEISGRPYGTDHADNVRFRIIADHARAGVMLVNDGVTPGNEGRGYVLRRLLRRIVRSSRLLGITRPILGEYGSVVRDTMSPAYPELIADFGRIDNIIRGEEEAFLSTLASGSRIFDLAAQETKSAGQIIISGSKAFQLHDTYGFPIDLTLEMAAEHGLRVDEGGFRTLMAEQRNRAKADAAARKTGRDDTTVYRELLDLGATEFTGYHELASEATVCGVIREGSRVRSAVEGDIVEVILDRTPLYAESGGQESDTGTIIADGVSLQVLDVHKVNRKLWVHQVRVTDGELVEGQTVLAQVDNEWRSGARQAHSGTHVLHAALREILGPNALQSGSYNKPGYLRLDFAWATGLSPETRSEVEEVANVAVQKDLPVRVVHTSIAEAQRMGALALFGETYEEMVRVVEIGGPWSRELCGGTHVECSSQIGPVTLINESSVGSGVRRIEAYVGIEAYRYLAQERTLIQNISSMLKVPDVDVSARIAALVERLHTAGKELERLRSERLLSMAGPLAAGAENVAGIAVVAVPVSTGMAIHDLRRLVNDVRHRLTDKPAVVALFTADADGGTVDFVVATTESARSRGLAADTLVASFISAIGGRGGGKPDMAHGAGTKATGIAQAIASVRREIARTR